MTPFATRNPNTAELDWLNTPAQMPCELSANAAREHQQQLTKPPGALGRLESVAIQLAGLQQQKLPSIDRVHITIFAADHGVARAGVSAFPQAVTAEMIRNFAAGGAAVAVLAKQLSAQLQVINLGTVSTLETIAGVDDKTIAPGTENFAEQPAMTAAQLTAALAVGKDCIDAIKAANGDLFIGGEMGIGNTTTASALAAILLNLPAATVVGPGTGVNQAGQLHKQQVIEQALQLHQLHELNTSTTDDVLKLLTCVGGFEIAALTGAYIRAAQQGIAVLVDGFITSVAALLALRLQPSIKPWLVLGHQSAEPGHQHVIAALELQPLLQLDMRLGEGSGAACAVPLLQLACRLHADMATFSSAGVSQ